MARLKSSHASEKNDNHAVVLVDFDNLAQLLGDGQRNQHQVVLDLVSELRRYLTEELRLTPVHLLAFGDFTTCEAGVGVAMEAVAAAGIEPRYVQTGMDDNDPAMGLAIQATELLQSRPDLSAFVVVSGDNWYVPLVQHLQRAGKFVLVAAVDLPQSMSGVASEVSDAFLNARYLLDTQDRAAVTRKRQITTGTDRAASPSPQTRAPSTLKSVDDRGAMRGLELIEEYFGQYEEVYLTPLLRKMSELLPDADGEPKDLVNTLQDAGAVWLEKRRGFPYDYTILVVNDEHPDVKEVRASSDDDSDYEPDDYPDSYEEPVEDDHEYEDTRA
ncbi:MAG: NYN domain-containing protein [Rhodothermales bacterium]|nr:NYN domain-containing protein [Rhodothermales bacterium]